MCSGETFSTRKVPAEAFCWFQAALPDGARPCFNPSWGTTWAKSSLNEVFSSVWYGRSPGLWFSKVTAEGKKKKKKD